MSLIYSVNNYLNRYPYIKKKIKRVVQLTMVSTLPEFKSEGDILSLAPNDSAHEYFFGYYDKSPWSADERYVLCLRTKDTWSDVAPHVPADLLCIDQKTNEIRILGTTNSWNVQQGCMLQWLGPDYKSRVIYNDFRDGRYCSVIRNIVTGEKRELCAPVYAVSHSGKFALTLDFSRLHRLRPGYGYSNLPDNTEGIDIPSGPCIWRLDLEKNGLSPLLKYTDLTSFEPQPEMIGATHKVNHIMISPNDNRFMVLHRWFKGERKYTRLLTIDTYGKDIYNLSDDGMVSHCCWKNNEEIFAFEEKKSTGSGYYLMRDKTQEYKRYWPEINYDGHPSFSPDGRHIVFDRYPDIARRAAVMIAKADDDKGNSIKIVAKVFHPFKYDNDTRCDLHPRWSPDGSKICFDSVFEGHRGLYVVKI